MTFLLIGASGFLGRHVHDVLAGSGPVVTVSRTAADVQLNLSSAGPGRIGDVLRDVQPDAVVNCAGVTNGTAEELAAGNVVAVADLLAAWQRERPTARLVHLGSAAEYGAVPPGRPISEDTPANPTSGYGHSKLAGTELVRSAHGRGLAATVLRVFNPLGPGTPATLLPGRLVAQLRHAAESGERARVGPLDAYRDFVDARDVAAAVLAAATATGPVPAVLNVAGGVAVGLRDFAALAAGIAGVEPPIEEVRGDAARSAAVSWQQADLTRIAGSIGWVPLIPLITSLLDMGLTDIRPKQTV
jgi:nucleoside-diphosphate-sugar epimerase